MGATYQRLIDTTFQSHIGRNLEAYVDDMVIKNNDEKMMLVDVAETFDNLRKINMRLNPKKCFLGMEEAERSLPVFNILKNITNENKHEYRWTIEVEESLQQMKRKNYAPMEKLALSLIHMTRRLLWYFEAHPVKVITDQPIKQILNKMEVSVPPGKDDTKSWTLFTDGSSSLKGSGVGLVLIRPSGFEYTYALWLTFTNTNNEAEYEAPLAGLRIVRSMKIQNLEAKVDSNLVASWINGSYVANSDSMIKYLAKAKEYIACFKSFFIKNILRNLNQKADMLSEIASVAFNHLPKEILVEVLNERSTETKEINTVVEEEGDNWMMSII
ncbi:reverse transcriptase domain-containing protein [Tanacetum coccineum]